MPEAYAGLFSAFFSTPTNVLSSEYTIEDPFAQDLSVRCGLFPRPQNANLENVVFVYDLGDAYAVAPDLLNQYPLEIHVSLQYTRSDGLVMEYQSESLLYPVPGIFWFGGAKATPDSPPNLTCELLSSPPFVGNCLSWVLTQFEMYCSDHHLIK